MPSGGRLGIGALVGLLVFGICLFLALFDHDLPLVWVAWGVLLGSVTFAVVAFSDFLDWLERRRRR